MKELSRACVVAVAGEIDAASSTRLARVERALEQEPVVVIDAERLTFCDTTFLRFLLRLKSHPNKRGRECVRIAGADARLQRIMHITGLWQTFTGYADVGSAVRDVQSIRTLSFA